jgi:hypothetical protein
LTMCFFLFLFSETSGLAMELGVRSGRGEIWKGFSGWDKEWATQGSGVGVLLPSPPYQGLVPLVFGPTLHLQSPAWCSWSHRLQCLLALPSNIAASRHVSLWKT